MQSSINKKYIIFIFILLISIIFIFITHSGEHKKIPIAGYEVCKKIREDYSSYDLAVLMLTVQNNSEAIFTGKSVGLRNVNKRLKRIYGYGIEIES